MVERKFSVVLVEPKDSLNIGSVARAMKNRGVSKLSLVRPRDFDLKRAKITACWADDIVEKAAVFVTLEEALKDEQDVIGFSGRTGKSRGGAVLLPQLVSELRMADTALVFGPEDNGLDSKDLALCRLMVRIPAAPQCSSYNLSHAVLLALAEITREELFLTNAECEGEDAHLPDWNDFSQLGRLVQSISEKSGFFREGTPEPVPPLLQNLVRRTKPNKREMSILLGLFSRIDRHIDYLQAAKG